MNLLIVDDNRLLLSFFTTYLRGKGHTAHTLTDPTKVKRWLELNSCDGVILDIGMPKIDGVTLLRTLRYEFPNLPIVMFTGLGYCEGTMTQCREAGASGYVSKGLGPLEAHSAIMRAIAHRPEAKT